MSSDKNPGNAGKGRKAGVPNKVPAALKQMILTALDGAGGVDYLIEQAHANPGAFLALIGKVLPTTLASDPNDPLVVEVLHITVDKDQGKR